MTTEQHYEIKLFTPTGYKVEIYSTTEKLEDFELRMKEKYKEFIQHYCKLIQQ